METRQYLCRPQPVRPSLPDKIIYTNIGLDFNSWSACATTNPQYWCVLYFVVRGSNSGYSLVSILL